MMKGAFMRGKDNMIIKEIPKSTVLKGSAVLSLEYTSVFMVPTYNIITTDR